MWNTERSIIVSWSICENSEAIGFELNPCDGCTANKIVDGKQMTMSWHVGDVKASHVDMEASEEFVEHLRGTHDDEEIVAINVNHGPRHDFSGMILDHSKRGKLTVDMIKHIEND